MIPEFPDAIRREISVEGGPADPEVIDDIPDKRVVHRVLEHRLNQASTDELRAEIRAAVVNHSVISWGHINLLGEYDFSDEKLRDSVGIPPPKIVLKSQGQMGGTKIRINGGFRRFSGHGHVALRTFASRNPSSTVTHAASAFRAAS